MTGIWTCPRCRASNGSHRATCALCGASPSGAPDRGAERPSGAPPPSSPPAAGKPSKPAPAPARPTAPASPSPRAEKDRPKEPARPSAPPRAMAPTPVHPKAPVHPPFDANEPPEGVVPRCPLGHADLAPGSLGDAPTLDCAACGGRWVDRRNVRAAVGAMTTFASGQAGREMRPRRLWSSAAPAQTGRPCPRCRAAMVRHAATASGPVWVDECPLRHGIWFDAGELEALAEFAREGGLAHHDAPAAHAHAAHGGLDQWNAQVNSPAAHATAFHWWWYFQ